jgi:hypothetical protein
MRQLWGCDENPMNKLRSLNVWSHLGKKTKIQKFEQEIKRTSFLSIILCKQNKFWEINGSEIE